MSPAGLLLSAAPAASAGGGITVGLVVGIQLAAIAALLGGFAWYVRGRRPGLATASRFGAALAGLGAVVLLIAAALGPAGSGGTLANPIPDTVDSVQAGAALYQANCARCHGVDGLGGGPDAATTQFPPANLRSGHLLQHTDADIFIWISGGIPGGMPAWSGSLSETDRWNLVNYLRAIDGRGPSPVPSAAGPPAIASAGLAGVLAVGLLAWLGAGLRRGRRSERRRGGR